MNKEQAIRQIVTSLDAEISLYTRYRALVEEELESVKKFNVPNSQTCAEKREKLCLLIAREREKRATPIESLASGDVYPNLTALVKAHTEGNDRALLLRKIEDLRKIVTDTRRLNTTLSLSVEYSLGLISSKASIVRSASHEVQREYTIHGNIRESVHPVASRSGGTLRQA
jgi:hypothetical protein